MNLNVYEAGTDLPAGTLAAVQELFRVSYYRYHYLAELASAERIKIVATTRGKVCGYASASQSGKLHRLADLLEDPGSRGIGLGRRLEQVRYDYMRGKDVSCYVSCTCEDTASQILKLDLGLRPVALKVGVALEFFGCERRRWASGAAGAPGGRVLGGDNGTWTGIA